MYRIAMRRAAAQGRAQALPFPQEDHWRRRLQDDKLAGVMRAIADRGLEIVKRSQFPGFTVLPKRWIVERTFAWFGRCRRLAKDFENRARIAVAFILLASSASCCDASQGSDHESLLSEQTLSTLATSRISRVLRHVRELV
jgi:transposase